MFYVHFLRPAQRYMEKIVMNLYDVHRIAGTKLTKLDTLYGSQKTVKYPAK